LLCCLLALLTSGSPGILLAPTQAQTFTVDPIESEERTPIEEDDDGKDVRETAGESRGLIERRARRIRASTMAVRAAWVTHLPHHHSVTAGFALLICTPFAVGASCLPLRC
jgi:hypothetical protein